MCIHERETLFATAGDRNRSNGRCYILCNEVIDLAANMAADALTRPMRIDFYRVVTPQGVTFEQLLQLACALPDDESRSLVYGGVAFRLQELRRGANIWQGDMIRIRMEDHPLKATLGGETELIELEDDEGIGEETAFLYDPAINVLVLQRNRSGVSEKRLVTYFAQKGETGPIALDPVVNHDVLDRLERMQTVRSLEVRVAGFEHADVYRGQTRAVEGMIGISEELSAPSLTIQATMGRQTGGLRNAIDFVRRLVHIPGQTPQEVQKIQVSGKEHDAADTEVLDILLFRMVETAMVPLGPDRRFAPADRHNAVFEAWQRQKLGLQERFGPRADG